MTPVLSLEEFFLTKLNIEWKAPAGNVKVSVESVDMNFEYDVARHVKDPLRRRMIFRAKCSEKTKKDERVGYVIEAEIVGLLVISDSGDEKRNEAIFRINGVSLLLGILRGMVATTTGSFPGGKFNIPSIMPQTIVKNIEEEKAKNAK